MKCKVKAAPKKFASNYDQEFKDFISNKIYSSGKSYDEIEALSEHLIKKSTIMNLAHGKSKPSVKSLVLLAKIFNFSVDEYFGIKGC